jgi:hypothetical protein
MFFSLDILSSTEHLPGSCGSRVIEWEEALDAQFLKRDVLWCARAPALDDFRNWLVREAA